MKEFSARVFGVLLAVLISVPVFAQSASRNTIQGFVFDGRSRIPMTDIYVELLNDTYSTLRRVKTDGSGRFYFGGLPQGNFKVKVLPYGTPFLEETQDAEIVNTRIGAAVFTSDAVYLDFYLKPDKRKINIDSSGTVGAVFVQEIPSEAKALYTKALANFRKPAEADLGFENASKAIAIFPDYYDALNTISIEYVRRDKFYEAIPHLVTAVRVNQRSFSCYYLLGIVAFNLKQYRESAEAFRLATILSPDNGIAHLKHGMVLRISGDYPAAEAALLKAESLSKSSPLADVYWQLGLLYNKLERFSEAAASLEKFLKISLDTENKQKVKALIESLKAKAASKKV